MDRVIQFNSPEQDMDLPKDQDVIVAAGWQSGPLPTQDLEDIAFAIFQREYPEALWYSSLMQDQRNDCRRFVLQLRPKFEKASRWTIVEAGEKFAAQITPLLFGQRRLGKTVRKEVADYADSCIADAVIAFRNRLFHARDVDANAAELAAEAAEGRQS